MAIVLANLMGVAGLAMAIYYFCRPGVVPEPLPKDSPVRAELERLRGRRKLTATLMMAVAVLFLIGMNLMEVLPATAVLTLWMVVLFLLMAVGALVWIDLRSLIAVRNELRERVDKQERTLQAMRGARDDREVE